MNTAPYNQPEYYYAAIKGVKVYLDYTNERLKILDYQYISENILSEIINFTKDEGLGKIISNCRIDFLHPFQSSGFVIEGIINRFFRGEDAYCVSCFINPLRGASPRRKADDSILSDTKMYSPLRKHNYTIRQANAMDIPAMIKLFTAVFASYPSPVFSVAYLEKVMHEQVLFKVAEEDGEIIGIASSDMDILNLNAEITDCATYPEHQGKGILQNIVHSLEDDLKEKGFCTAYSLARAVNPGINKALSRLEYKYGGRLVNNCHICGGFEDMNVWVKILG